jgi:succinyl-diaminopimelate desuccinylase
MRDLLYDTAALVDIASVSHNETQIANVVEARLRGAGEGQLEVVRIANNVVARTHLGRPMRLVLAGHLDTVPVNANDKARISGDTLWGLGAADMKGGLAVMLDLAESAVESSRRLSAGPIFDLTFAFYACEEVERTNSGLLEIEAADASLLGGDAAILGEPTGSRIEAGCQGVLKAEVTFVGTRAHTARPWMGSNAIHRMGNLLVRLGSYDGRRPLIDGCEYREALQAVSIQGGVAGNVVPDCAIVALNHRYAPDRDGPRAEAALRTWLEASIDLDLGDRIEVVDHSPAAAPNLGHPAIAALLEGTGNPARAKLGWTDVDFFAERRIPAVNFGPGDPEVAHTKDERVTKGDLVAARKALGALIGLGA